MDGYIPFAPRWAQNIRTIAYDERIGIYEYCRFANYAITRVLGVGAKAFGYLQLMSNLKFVDLVAISSSCSKPELLTESNVSKIVEQVKKTVLGTDIGIIITALEDDDAEAQVSIKIAQVIRETGALTLAFVIKSPTDAPAGISQLKEAVDTLFVCEEEEQLPSPLSQHHDDEAIQYEILDAVSALICALHAPSFIGFDFSDFCTVFARPRAQGTGHFGRFGQGVGQGEHTDDAVHHAMKALGEAPAVIKNASAILVIARANANFNIANWSQIDCAIQEYTNEEAEVKYVLFFDDNMAEDQISTTIFLTWPADYNMPNDSLGSS